MHHLFVCDNKVISIKKVTFLHASNLLNHERNKVDERSICFLRFDQKLERLFGDFACLMKAIDNASNCKHSYCRIISDKDEWIPFSEATCASRHDHRVRD